MYFFRLYLDGNNLVLPKPVVVYELNPRHVTNAASGLVNTNGANLDFEHVMLNRNVSSCANTIYSDLKLGQSCTCIQDSLSNKFSLMMIMKLEKKRVLCEQIKATIALLISDNLFILCTYLYIFSQSILFMFKFRMDAEILFLIFSRFVNNNYTKLILQ